MIKLNKEHDNVKFGDLVSFANYYTRVCQVINADKEGQQYQSDYWKLWSQRPLDGSGIFLGFRTLQDGIRRVDNYSGYYFIPKAYFKAALVSPGPNTNPLYIPLDHLRINTQC